MGYLCLGLLISGMLAVPEPRPVDTAVKVGCYYFPGFFHAARWSPLKDYGSPVPLLGYYRDGAPDVADWHIKWALENGISCFVFDWYYDYQAGRVSEHNTALDVGFLKAAYRDRLEFAIFWCNEEPADWPLYTEEQMMTLARTLGERYFSQPNYLRIQDRPVVFVSVPARLQASFDVGFADLIPRLSRAAGLPEGTNIFFVAKQSEGLPELKRMGFAAGTAYNYAGVRVGPEGSPLRASYHDMIDGYEKMWQQVTQDSALPYIVPVSPGWDSRPWYGPRAFVRTGSSPALFREMCERARKYVDPRLNMVIAECWNEFGEGSYLEPCQGFGFGYLEALREVFGAGGPYPENVVPSPPFEGGAGGVKDTAWPWVYPYIPPDPSRVQPGQQQGNLLIEPGFEAEGGWVNFAGGPSRLTEAGPRSGQHCLTVQPSEGAKPCVHVPIRFGGTYELAAWIRCSPGVSARCQAALFDRHGNWLRRYAEVGETNKTEWSRVATQFSVHEPDLGGIDLEFTAHEGDIFVDDAEIVLVAEEPEVTPDFVDSCDPPSNPPLAKGGKGGWVLLEGGKPTVEPLGPDGSNALRVPAGSGVKTIQTFPAGPGRSYGIRLKFRCEEMATIEVRLPELDEEGKWLRRYAAAGLFSWQEWIEVPCSAQFPADSRAAKCCLEVVALGGQAWIDDVRLFQVKGADKKGGVL